MKTDQAINQISKTINFLVEAGKLGETSRKNWERMLNLLIQGRNIDEAYISRLESEKYQQYIHIQRLEKHILCLEAICLMHGITDAERFLAQGPDLLKQTAENALNEGWIITPRELKNHTEKNAL